ncbi:MAG: D-alanyl-D-alanine carboxypeptidase/D-alanyl-D-alanine-endopeptidase [Deltaproteobacteria bacterium]|nr:D-alanyl-D-alanine carboxypeptidase/D-alanyl-D-alanine-endopeptidase [Deltaproteobacteria bacterium]
MTRRQWIALTAIIALGLVGLAPTTSDAQRTNQDAALAAELETLVRGAGLQGARVGVSVIDVASGAVVFEHQPDELHNPASNMKVVTAAAALALLGPEHRITTALAGRLDLGQLAGPIVLRGRGDPTLRYADLLELANDLSGLGVRRVDGIVVDDRFFEPAALAPAFEQQPGEMAPFRAAIGAASVDANAYRITAVPTTEGAPARIDLLARGYFEVSGQVLTAAAGTPPDVRVQQTVEGDRLRLRVSGTVPAGVRQVGYARRVEHPWAYAGHALADALRSVGIRVSGGVSRGAAPPGAAVLVSHQSPPLSQMIHAMGKASDNFTAEMVLRLVAAERARVPGTSADGARLVGDYLVRTGARAGAFTLRNGSGLFDANRLTARQLAGLLAYVARDPTIAPEYFAHLATMGVDGTLSNRLRDAAVARHVRAKSGTLNDAISLSGYVLGPGPAPRVLAFSALTSGVRGRHGPARALCDGVPRTVLAALHRRAQ